MNEFLTSISATHLEMRFKTNLEIVGVVRRFVAELYQRTRMDADDVDRIAMATHELLENAIRFSKDGLAALRIDLFPGNPSSVSIRTENSATAENCASVSGRVAAIKVASDPYELYSAVMRASAAQTHGSGLGLARVFAEGELRLECVVQGSMVVVTANGVLAGGES